MRRLVWLVLVICTREACAQESPPSEVQMLIQAGFIPGSSVYGHGPGASGSIGVLWLPWKSGGIWSEAGVLDEPVSSGYYPFAETPDTPDHLPRWEESSQHLEASAGLIAIGPKASGGFFRAGVGAFRVESDYTSQKFLVNVPAGSQSALYSLTRWTMGAILGTGLRFGSERMRAMPTVEARLVLEPGASGEGREFVLVSGGLWFR
jgi:hypothetical protein